MNCCVLLAKVIMTLEPEIPVITDNKTVTAMNETKLNTVEISSTTESASESQTDLETADAEVVNKEGNVNDVQLASWGKYGRTVLWIGLVFSISGEARLTSVMQYCNDVDSFVSLCGILSCFQLMIVVKWTIQSYTTIRTMQHLTSDKYRLLVRFKPQAPSSLL